MISLKKIVLFGENTSKSTSKKHSSIYYKPNFHDLVGINPCEVMTISSVPLSTIILIFGIIELIVFSFMAHMLPLDPLGQ